MHVSVSDGAAASALLPTAQNPVILAFFARFAAIINVIVVLTSVSADVVPPEKDKRLASR